MNYGFSINCIMTEFQTGNHTSQAKLSYKLKENFHTLVKAPAAWATCPGSKHKGTPNFRNSLKLSKALLKSGQM